MAQQIRELMTQNPVSLPGTASVHEAARAMRDANIGDVIVIEHNQVCGMVTDRDIVVRLVAEARDPATTTLADLCSHAVVTVRPTDSIEDAVRLMRTHAIRRVPVVEGGRRWAWCRWGIWQWSGIRARRWVRSAPLRPIPKRGQAYVLAMHAAQAPDERRTMMHTFLQPLKGRAPGQTPGAQRVLSTLLTATLLLALVAVPVQAQTFPFTALLTSGQEPPPNTNDSKAFGVAFVTFNTETGEVCFSISYDEEKLTSAETVAHFHAPAPPARTRPSSSRSRPGVRKTAV